MKLPLCILAASLCCGCSATHVIADRAQRVQVSAYDSIAILVPHVEDGAPPEAVQQVLALQRDIIVQASVIGRAVTQVDDTTPWWGTLLTWASIGAAAWAVVAILARFGIQTAAVTWAAALWGWFVKLWRGRKE